MPRKFQATSHELANATSASLSALPDGLSSEERRPFYHENICFFMKSYSESGKIG